MLKARTWLLYLRCVVERKGARKCWTRKKNRHEGEGEVKWLRWVLAGRWVVAGLSIV